MTRDEINVKRGNLAALGVVICSLAIMGGITLFRHGWVTFAVIWFVIAAINFGICIFNMARIER